MGTQNIRLFGLNPIWAHNLFVLWAFGFPTVGGPMLGRPKYTSISSPFTLPHRITLLLSLSVHSIFLVVFPAFPNPFPSLPISYLQLNISGWAMITLGHQWAWGSNSFVSKWVLRWEQEKWHWNCLLPRKICLATIFPRQCWVTEGISPSSAHLAWDIINRTGPR